MKHLRETQIIACTLDLGEPRWAGHLAGCTECRTQAARVQALLAAAAPAAPPAAPPDLAARIWRALPPAPAEPRPRLAAWFAPARAALLAAGAGAVLAAGLLLARPQQRPAHLAARPAGAGGGSRRGLLLAAAAHLDRTQALLVELKHAPAGADGVINLAPERAAARQLLASNRFYERTFTAGPPQATGIAAATLSRLEPVLIEIEHAPPRASHQEWEAMEVSIARNAVLFKVRVLQQTLRARALTSKEDGSL